MLKFWRDRRVFLTGHTGFKGAWLNLWLQDLGAKVTGYALAPHTEPSMFALMNGRCASHIADIRDERTLRDALIGADPQIVIHLAAQALVRESYRDPLATYATNVMGTGVVLQACRSLGQLECVLVVTSDKVYENHGEGRPFVEDDRLGGHDPYSNSKACAELLTGSFRDSFFTDARADRHRPRRQCHWRRRLVARSTDSRLRSCAQGRRAGFPAVSRGDSALAACA